jgi:hypothetical protein
LPPGSIQPAATTGLDEPLAVLALPPAASLEKQLAVLELLLLPQPPAARLAATSTLTLATAGRLTKQHIWLARTPRYVRGSRRSIAASENYRTAARRAFSLTFSITQRDAICRRNVLPAESSHCGVTGLKVAVGRGAR